MRIFVSGATGQVARSLAERASRLQGVTLIHGARPGFDLTEPEQAQACVRAAKPDLIVSAAAYTAVDKAEAEADLARAINHGGADMLARTAFTLSIPIIHLSTDYVYSGEKTTPYLETDVTGPLGVYGATKLLGEKAVAAANPWHVILRTAWVFSPFGQNFVKTMLRLGSQRDALAVVADQLGNPTYAPDLADCILALSGQLLRNRDVSGVYHVAGSGEASWFDFAAEIFRLQAEAGLHVPRVTAITTQDYPTLARRPANSRLDCAKLKNTFGLEMPFWKDALRLCITRLHQDTINAWDAGGTAP
jgi:dTDP-4-dehydrorhamnose reductase